MSITSLANSLEQLMRPLPEVASSQILEYFQLFLSLCIIHIAVAFAVYIATVYIDLFPRFRRTAISKGKRVLFVIAHPDDECMFFGPSIITLTDKKDANIHLLCLSNGNYDKEGYVRQQELFSSCILLGISPSNITLMNCSDFPDNPKIKWDQERLAEIILNHIETLDIDTVVTFDEDGVSGHTNHISIYKSIFYLASKRVLPENCLAYSLDTVNILRKYTSFFDSLLALLFDSNLFIISFKERRRVVRAMHAHKSQLVWFRRLYILFSRYFLINAFTPISDQFDFELD